MSAPVQPTIDEQKKRKNTTIIIVAAIGGVCFFCCIIMAAVLFPVFAQARVAAMQTSAMDSLKSDAVSLQIYSADNDDHFPSDMSMNVLAPILAEYSSKEDASQILHPLPGEPATINQELAGLEMFAIDNPARTELFTFTSPKLQNRILTCYVDTSVRATKQ